MCNNKHVTQIKQFRLINSSSFISSSSKVLVDAVAVDEVPPPLPLGPSDLTLPLLILRDDETIDELSPRKEERSSRSCIRASVRNFASFNSFNRTNFDVVNGGGTFRNAARCRDSEIEFDLDLDALLLLLLLLLLEVVVVELLWEEDHGGVRIIFSLRNDNFFFFFF